jgi:PAS domain S-box-containing protein
LSETEQAIAVARVSDAAFVDVSDGFCALVGRRRDELLGRTAAELGISHRDRLDWLISRFPERGRSHHQQRVFETPRGRVLADMDIHGIEIGGERLIVSVITAVSDAASPHETVLGAILEATPLGVVLYDRDIRIVRVNRAVERIGLPGPSTSGCGWSTPCPTPTLTSWRRSQACLDRRAGGRDGGGGPRRRLLSHDDVPGRAWLGGRGDGRMHVHGRHRPRRR